MKKKSGFTILEVVIVMTGFFVLLVIILQLYQKMIRLKYWVEAKQNLIQQTYYMLEKINVELKDFTIDYEEYFNRQMVGCDTSDYWDNFLWNINSWNINWYCDNITYFWNKNSIVWQDNNKHIKYYCSSLTTYIDDDIVFQSTDLQNWSWCFDPTYFTGPYFQTYNQYQWQFRDVKDDVDFVSWAVNDDDDDNFWLWPKSIIDTENIQELYFISQDWSKRIYLRRALIDSWDRNGDWVISWDNEHLYTIQLLKLKWFDAWENHDFDITNPWVYDWEIDTRVCDYAEWFICNWASINDTVYSWYRMPSSDINDWRVNLFDDNLTTSNRNILVYPDTNLEYSRANDNIQINPYITLSITNKLYWKKRKHRIGNESMNAFQLTLQTTFNTKNFYSK